MSLEENAKKNAAAEEKRRKERIEANKRILRDSNIKKDKK